MGRALRPRDYWRERQAVEDFLQRHRDHPAVTAGLKLLGQWLEDAADGKAVPGCTEMRRLAGHGVSPLSILTEAGAVFLLAQWDPRKLSDDTRLTFMLGIKVLALAPFSRRLGTLKGRRRTFTAPPGKVARREVGLRLRTTLAPLLMNMAQAISAEVEASKAQTNALHVPFNQST